MQMAMGPLNAALTPNFKILAQLLLKWPDALFPTAVKNHNDSAERTDALGRGEGDSEGGGEKGMGEIEVLMSCTLFASEELEKEDGLGRFL